MAFLCFELLGNAPGFIQIHFKHSHKNEYASISCIRVKHVKIIRYRKDEALCVLNNNEGVETVEWIDVEDILEGHAHTNSDAVSIENSNFAVITKLDH